ncbi:Cationic amino acid transporter [Candidatus Zixiibacteriota bacterium]|nr:Cationic amino acid transporter [candidate division Zixibacteria bacterium]
MTLMDTTLIGVGAMIGAGIFVLTGIAAGVAGPALILAFALNGIIAVFTAMSYAELGSCYHDAGGGYLWVKEGLPRWNGFLSGWMSWFAHAVACSLYALGFGAYFDLVLHEFGWSLPHWGVLSPQKLLAAAVALLFAYINYRGASETGKIGNLVTIAKLVILAVFIAFGLSIVYNRGDFSSSLTPFMPHGWDGVFKAMGLTFIAFQGYEVIAQCSEEVRNPRRNIPLATFLALLIVVPIYILVAIAALGTVQVQGMTPWDYLAANKETALVLVAKGFFVGGGVMLLVGGLISTMSALNATVYSSSRVAFAMGRDRNFPTFFSSVSKKKYTPHWAILISIVIVVLMAVSLPIEDVASAADIMFLLLFLQVNIAMIRLRRKRPDLDRGFIAPLFPWLTIAGILLLLFLAIYMFNYSVTAWIVTGIWVVLGLSTYRFYAAHREVEHARKISALTRLEQKQFRILACISSPKTAAALSHIAIALAKKHNSEIKFLHVIEAHEGQKLYAGALEAERAIPILNEAAALAETESVPADTIIQVSHRISYGIVEAADEERCNLLVLGRQKQPSFVDRVFSSLVDTVVNKSAAEVAVLHGSFEKEKVKKIILPLGANVHTRLAVEMAPALVQYFNAGLFLVQVADKASDISQVERVGEEAAQELVKNGVTPSFISVKGTSIINGVIYASRDADLLLMGGRSGDLFELLLARSLSEEITLRVSCPVLWAREYVERKSFWGSLLSRQSMEVTSHE